MVINDNEKTSRIFFCKFCDYKTSRLYNWERHILTPKHKMVMHSARFTVTKTTLEKNEKKQFDMSLSSQTGCSFSEQKMPKNEQKPKQRFFCDYCNKSFAYKSGLCRHVQKCSNVSKTVSEYIKTEDQILDKIEEKNQELLKAIDNKLKLNTNINQQVNINIFLNDDCKHAMDITDFVEGLRISMEDLYYTKNNGYAPGISNILNKYLIALKPTERPIHCINTEKLHFYIKNDNSWNEDEGEELDKKIDDIKQKQINKIKDWETENINWKNDEVKRQEYLQIVNNVYGSNNKGENIEIKKLISKTTNIKK